MTSDYLRIEFLLCYVRFHIFKNFAYSRLVNLEVINNLTLSRR